MTITLVLPFCESYSCKVLAAALSLRTVTLMVLSSRSQARRYCVLEVHAQDIRLLLGCELGVRGEMSGCGMVDDGGDTSAMKSYAKS